MVYQAIYCRVVSPKRFPMYSGNVVTFAPKYRGAKTTASIRIKGNAYQEKFPATIPVSYPLLALAINIDGPTLVPHMVRPMANQPNDLFARKRLLLLFFLLKLDQ